MIERLLEALTARLPCRFIDGEGGEPYLERYYLGGALGWRAYLHRFVDSDPDRGLHDHPWGRALSLVLVSGYDEIREKPVADAPTIRRFVRPWRINWLRGDDFHRVILRGRRPAWTLFLHGPRTKGGASFRTASIGRWRGMGPSFGIATGGDRPRGGMPCARAVEATTGIDPVVPWLVPNHPARIPLGSAGPASLM
jgi:hypothetical protein